MEGTRNKILVIDDDPDVQTLLRLIFQKAGYQVFAALDAEQGIELARQAKPDLIVLDLMIPGGGGAHVYESLREQSGPDQLRFLIYSAADRSDIPEQIRKAPSLTVLSKSAKMEQLVEAAARLLEDSKP